MESSDSALDALLCLSPPSPSLSSSGMTVSLTSGTIPIFLDTSEEIGTHDFERDEVASDIPQSPASLCQDAFLDASAASPGRNRDDHRFSCNTFGPAHSDRQSRWIYEAPAGDLAQCVSVAPDSPRAALSRAAVMKDSSSELRRSYRFPATSASFGPRRDSKDIGLKRDGSSDKASGQSTASMRPSSSHSLASDLTTQSSTTLNEMSPQLLYEYTPSNSETQTLMDEDDGLADGRPLQTAPSAPHSTIVEIPRTSLEKSPTPDMSSPVMSTLAQHGDIPWLKDIVVELLIDQEGFRSVHPVFELSGYSTFAGSLHPDGKDCDGGVAEFMPIQRQSFNFHYAPFDSPPILRRVTVNRREERDYITRQAILNVKANGVYAVRGIETNTFSVPYTKEGSEQLYAHVDCKMRWKLEYLVGDRRLEKTGRFMDGEKTLTPLTFSCSPLLLHPNQGKKVKLMHLVRKTVAPKLVAERLELPRRLQGPAGTKPGYTAPAAQAPGPEMSNGAAHRRAYSQTPVVPRPHDSTTSGQSGDPAHAAERLRGRRRASSAGERPKPASGVESRHIVPKNQLTQMLDSYSAMPSGPKPLAPYRPSKLSEAL
ncbi:hypothetical protein ONZ45_g207 [Pleurotus djamor]|nr:hypothetical protein ONZ45_g207 [Pleurotus djamor]